VLDVLCADAEEELQLSDEISDQLFRLSSELSCRHGRSPQLREECREGVIELLMNLTDHNVSTK
jgi:hypothetical protein